MAPSARIETRDLPIYVNNLKVADFRDREAEADLDFGRDLGNWGEIRAGFHRTNGATRVRYGDPNLVEEQYNKGEYFFRFSYDRLDNVHFPREGQTFSLQWDANRTNLGADIASDRVQADWLMARFRRTQYPVAVDFRRQHAGRQISIDGAAGVLFPRRILQSVGPCTPIAHRTQLCRHPGDLFSKNRPRRRGFLRVSRLRRHVFRSRQYLEHRGDMSFASARKDASLFFAFDTFLGPVYLGSGYDQAGTAAFYLFLGAYFLGAGAPNSTGSRRPRP